MPPRKKTEISTPPSRTGPRRRTARRRTWTRRSALGTTWAPTPTSGPASTRRLLKTAARRRPSPAPPPPSSTARAAARGGAARRPRAGPARRRRGRPRPTPGTTRGRAAPDPKSSRPAAAARTRRSSRRRVAAAAGAARRTSAGAGGAVSPWRARRLARTRPSAARRPPAATVPGRPEAAAPRDAAAPRNPPPRYWRRAAGPGRRRPRPCFSQDAYARWRELLRPVRGSGQTTRREGARRPGARPRWGSYYGGSCISSKCHTSLARGGNLVAQARRKPSWSVERPVRCSSRWAAGHSGEFGTSRAGRSRQTSGPVRLD